jgi:hypothetical protein
MLLRHDRPDRDCIVAETAHGARHPAPAPGDGRRPSRAHRAGRRPPEALDLALVELEAPVCDVAELGLYEDSDEEGREVLLLGRGDFGNGRDGVLGTDHRLRWVTNRVDSADDRWLRMRFDLPPDCTALEG